MLVSVARIGFVTVREYSHYNLFPFYILIFKYPHDLSPNLRVDLSFSSFVKVNREREPGRLGREVRERGSGNANREAGYNNNIWGGRNVKMYGNEKVVHVREQKI